MPELPQIPAQAGIEVAPAFPRPPIAPGAASSALAEVADSVEQMATYIATRLNETRRVAQFNLAEADYRSQADDISFKILRDPSLRSDPDAARQALREQLAPLQEQIHNKYPNADWNGGLTRNMSLWGEARVRVLGHAAVDNLDQDTKADLRAKGVAAINQAVNAADPSDQISAVVNHYQHIDLAAKRGVFTAGEAQLENQNFTYSLGQAKFDQFARNNPGQVLAMQNVPDAKDVLPKWLNDVTGGKPWSYRSGSRTQKHPQWTRLNPPARQSTPR